MSPCSCRDRLRTHLVRDWGRNVKKLPLVALVLTTACLVSTSDAAILNTLVGFDHTPGWTGKLQADLSASGGNTELFSLSTAARAQYQGARHRFRLIGGYTKTRSGSQDIAESAFGHLRHNYELTRRVSTLEFVQVQHDPFQSLRRRTLAGLGARLDLLRAGKRYCGVGVAHMFEWEKLSGGGSKAVQKRMSAFVDLELATRKGVKVTATGFVQPRWKSFSDYRAIADLGVEATLAGSLSLTTGFDWSYDARPAPGVKRTDWSVSTGLSLSL